VIYQSMINFDKETERRTSEDDRMKKGIIISVMLAAFLTGCGKNESAQQIKITSSQEAVEALNDGNEKYLSEKTTTVTTQEMREDLTENGQHPYAVVITCSDSRVPVEEIFSCNAGEIFVIRTAGNVIDDLEMGSIEYGVEHCGASLVLVLGHTNCGAVTAAVEGESEGNNIDAIIRHIEPAVEEAKKTSNDKDSIIYEGVRINVLNDIEQIKADATIKNCIDNGDVEVKGAIYDIEKGTVKWLP